MIMVDIAGRLRQEGGRGPELHMAYYGPQDQFIFWFPAAQRLDEDHRAWTEEGTGQMERVKTVPVPKVECRLDAYIVLA